MCASLNTGGDQEMSTLWGMEKEDVDSAEVKSSYRYTTTISSNFMRMKKVLMQAQRMYTQTLQATLFVSDTNSNIQFSNPKLNTLPARVWEQNVT